VSRPAPERRPAPQGRQELVLERVESFRRRRPRLADQVVTLAHGAGGKASAALVDAVFLEAFRNEALEQYVAAVGGQLEITVRTGSRKLALVGPTKATPTKRAAAPPPPGGRKKSTKTA